MLSSLPVNGDFNPETQQATPSWMSIEQLKRTFEIETLEPGLTGIPDSVNVLVIVHPRNLSEETLFAVDQYVMQGGGLVAFVDPMAETQGQGEFRGQPPVDQHSDLNRLTSAWGVEMRLDAVLGDSQNALTVSGSDGNLFRHLAIQRLTADNLSRQDVTTGLLENLNVATPGILDIAGDVNDRIEVLMRSSTYAMPLPASRFQYMRHPDALHEGFSPTGEVYALAVRISGAADSAFPEGLASVDGEAIASSDNINVVLVADTDLLSDRLWVQIQNFFGQRLASPFADNGALVVNTMDNMAGSSALISVRSRGRFSRPFEVVQGLRREAEARFREREEALQMRLTETETKLRELQDNRQSQNLLALSPEQAQAVREFEEEKLKIRKELRDVRHQLNKDIEDLGGWLKFLNIGLMPLLLTLGLFLLYRYVFAARREA